MGYKSCKTCESDGPGSFGRCCGRCVDCDSDFSEWWSTSYGGDGIQWMYDECCKAVGRGESLGDINMEEMMARYDKEKEAEAKA